MVSPRETSQERRFLNFKAQMLREQRLAGGDEDDTSEPEATELPLLQHLQDMARTFDALMAGVSSTRCVAPPSGAPVAPVAPAPDLITGSALHAARRLRQQGYAKPTISSTRRRSGHDCSHWTGPAMQADARDMRDARDVDHLLRIAYSPSRPGGTSRGREKTPWRLSNIEPEPWHVTWDKTRRILSLGECRELELHDGDALGDWQCPSPELSHELLCTAPLTSDETHGQSMTQIPQTRPQLPEATGAKASREVVSDEVVPKAGPQPAPEAKNEAMTGGSGGGYPGATGGAGAVAAAAPAAAARQKSKFIKVRSLTPDSQGVSLFAKVVEVRPKVDGSPSISEVVVGDHTGTITLRAPDPQVELCKPGAVLHIENAQIVMLGAFMRLEAESIKEFEANVKNDLSAVEYPRAD
ncbi:unnamed protein product [Cladocopium goreaui]|uniref:Uncharacterized protein At4g28440 n=1 Tax=Cladocopium goreaui TaxID=2562237 RepID=A0A9P1BFR1_9DINO|nr:unnamed protein product [Cladocopium goreaui]